MLLLIRFSLLLALCLSSLVSLAQTDYFQVVVVHGTVSSKAPKSELKLPLSPGAKVLLSDIVVLSDPSSYLGLIHSSGKVLELTNPGTYLMQSYKSQYPPGKSNTSLGMQPIIAEIVQYQKEIENGTFLNVPLTPTHFKTIHGGGVMEHIIFLSTHAGSVSVYDSVYLNWTCCYDGIRTSSNNNNYSFKIHTLVGDLLYKGSTKDTFMVIPIPDKHPEYGWQVAVMETGDPTYQQTSATIKFLSPAQKETIRAELVELKSLLQSNGALANTMIGFYFHLQNLHQNAYQYLLFSALQAPRVKLYKMNKAYYLYKTSGG